MPNKKRILVISPHYHTFVKSSVEPLSAEVTEVQVFVHHNLLSEFAHLMPFSYFKHVENFSRSRLIDYRNKPSNINVHLISMLYFMPDGKNSKLGDILFNKYRRYILHHNLMFDLIHAHFTWPSGYAAIKLAKEFNVPVIITLHENRGWLLKLAASNKEEIYSTWALANALIRVNKKDIPLLRKYNPNVYSIPNGVDFARLPSIDKTAAKQYLSLPERKKLLFCLGNLIERKGFGHLIDSMNEIIKSTTDVLCIIGGSGPLKNSLNKKIMSLHLHNYVKLIDFVPDQDLKYWMNAADLFILPSLSESFGLVALEALAVGTPVVATINGGTEEFVTSDDYGYLVKPGDATDLAEKILVALDKQWDMRKIMRYSAQYRCDIIAKKIMAVYDHFLTNLH